MGSSSRRVVARTFLSISSELRRSGLEGLQEGQRVSFEAKIDPRKGKPNAVGIKVLGGAVPTR